MALQGNRSGGENRVYDRSLLTRLATDLERRREQEESAAQPAGDVASDGTAPLRVELAELYARDNAKSHHTERFRLVDDHPATPVLRRGLPFFCAFRFDRQFDLRDDLVRLVFDFGPKPAVPKGTRIILPVSENKEFTDIHKWEVRVHQKDGNNVTFQVHIPATAQVGMWRCSLQSNRKGRSGGASVYNCDVDVYILFNAWCKEDGVYLESEELRQEYVLNDMGKVWTGSYRQPIGRRWVFGQFDAVVLPAVVYLMERCRLAHEQRGSPVQMARAISAVVNSPNEDGGLLVGKWAGDYKDGVAPTAWTGSVAILERYLQDGGQSVQYGQCWVFSALTVTVCRALGIPCRSVTNFVSAHDADRSLTIDKYFARDGGEIPGGPDGSCHDSAWNFHVWNDVWMTRPDLPPGCGGWQAIDATPQETSASLYQCGPASVEAVRKGDVGFLYDTGFVFAEVNADVCHYKEDGSSLWGFSKVHVDKYHVGRRVVTKMPGRDDDAGDDDIEDITQVYKNAEGSECDRRAALNAARGLDRDNDVVDVATPATADDVWFDLVEIDSVPFGQGFSLNVHIHNKSNAPRSISAVVAASSVKYTGETAYRLKRANGDFTVRPQERESLQLKIGPKDYINKLVDQSLIKIYASATVKETNQTWSEEDDFSLVKPRLQVQVRGSPYVGQECQADFSFQNPLNAALTACSFSVEGPGLQRPKQLLFRDVKPGELVTFTENFRPHRAGETKIVAAFNSDQLTDVSGSASVYVQG